MALLLAAPARADFFTSSPGPLAAAHARLDGSDHCRDCHDGARAVSVDKCLACHKPVAERRGSQRGVHGSGKAHARECRYCHTDHAGRDADILGWPSFGDRAGFDHTAFTAFPLEGKHAKVECGACHKQKTPSGTRTYLAAPTSCAGCHDNPHGPIGEPLKRCERCHDERSWKMRAKADFDHLRDTRYPLEKKHQSVECGKCHGPGARPPSAKAPPDPRNHRLTFRYPGWGTDCTPCHDNVHGKSLFGQKDCKLCHAARREFAEISFAHERTKFPLEGAHRLEAGRTCRACHTKDNTALPDRRCAACHADVHAGRFAAIPDCAACHSTTNFGVDLRFDHTAKTRFALTGAHAAVDCRACHRGRGPKEWERLDSLIHPHEKAAVDCMGCHRHERTHDRQYRSDRCLDCHKLAGVLENRKGAAETVHGPKARFPLTLGHARVECARCHPGGVFTGAPLQCGPACHPDELHRGSLGPDCQRCHAGGRWAASRFDHDTMTKWPLAGNHHDLECALCHEKRVFTSERGKGAKCVNCHRRDDPHLGCLPDCEKCHSPDGALHFDHQDRRDSDWPLEGRHKRVQCVDCHQSMRFKPAPRECSGCHGEPEVHRGQLGTRCGDCHLTTDWKLIHTGHDSPPERFGGAHDRVPCARCHPGGRLLAGTSALCIACHRNDDIHHNALGPRCGDCHTQRTFAGAHFEHTRVGCELTGTHRLLPCVDCHKGGNFTALSPECQACHRADAIRGAAAPGAPPGHQSYQTCTPCHNPLFFGPVARSSNRESVCR